ncbi:MAG TPA: hypothetical protein VMZ49_11875 [Patescibacteria group bacterium]|nr:hypothetical protein [Patescibacteria group bacterium]
MEKRKNTRYDVLQEMKGKLYNVVSFLVNNISIDGVNLICNFQPVIGSTYRIYLIPNSDGSQQDFEIEISRAEVAAFDPQKYSALAPGLLFSVGARFKALDQKQRGFLTAFIKKKSNGLEEGFISKDKIQSGS